MLYLTLHFSFSIKFIYNRFMYLKIFTLYFIVAFSILSANSVIDVSKIVKPLDILPQTKVYVDPEGKHDFKYISKRSDILFKKCKKSFLHLGYTSDVVWLKFTLKNSANTEIKKVLEISNQMLDEIELYTKEDNNKYIKHINGARHNLSYGENIVHMYFNILLRPAEIKEYYLKVSSQSSSVYFKLNLMSKDQLYQKEIRSQLILALFFGSIFALIIYNLFIFYFSKDLAYLYYVMYLLFTVLEQSSYSAINFYIFSEKFLQIDVFLAIFYICNVSIFAILFLREYLNTKKYKKIDYIFKFFIAVNIIFIFISRPSFYPMDAVVTIGMLSLIYIIFVSFYLLYKGENNAKYMIVGWSISMFAWIMQGTYDMGAWSILYKYPYFFEVSIFVEAILFSVALVNKLNKTKELEKSVQTNEILTKELHHRIKNNMQFIISMYRLKLAKYSNCDLSNSLKEVEGTIQAMSTTHEMLYTQNTISELSTKNYLHTLIERLKENYNNAGVCIHLDLRTSLDMDTSIYVGIILNEFIANSYKYAFDGSSGQIDICLFKKDNTYVLNIKDNGKGFDQTQQKDTFGLELVKTLVENELKGQIEINATKGCQYLIEW